MTTSGLDQNELEKVESGFGDEEVREPSPKVEMAPEQALERIRRGEPVENVRIKGLHFRGEFAQPVQLKGVVLVQPQFEGATFQREVTFSHCVLDRPRFGRATTFANNWTLSESTLLKAHIHRVTVRGGFFCNHLQTRGRFLVSLSHFQGRVSFWEARFRGWVDFKECEFAQEVDFRSFHAEEGFVLTRSRFAGNVMFRGTSVCKKWEGNGARFEALLDFSKAKLHDFVYLEGIEQGDRQRFAFVNALAERFLVRPTQLDGRLASEEKGDYDQAMHEYALLKRCFGALHRYEHEDWAFYRFKVNQRRSVVRSWLRPWTKLTQVCDWLFLDQGCGYGTNPLRAVRAALLIILGFGLIYMLGINHFYFDEGKLPFNDRPVTSWPNRLLVGLVMSVSVFTSGFSGIRDLAKDWMNVPLIVESLLGTLLWGLFIVAFSRKVIR